MKYLVFDVGGTDIKYAIMNEKAEFLKKNKVPTPLDKIDHFLETIQAIYGNYSEMIEGIAVSMPGRIDSDRGYAFTGGSLRYNDNVDIVSMIKKFCSVPVTVENDGKCAALAEAWQGSLADCNDGIVVILGTGIGGGIIKDKKLHRGSHFAAGEFSYIKTDFSPTHGDNIEDCWSNQNSTSALCRLVATAKGLPEKDVDGYAVFKFVNSGDDEVLQILDDFCYKIAIQLFNLQYIYDPEKIAIGGGISAEDMLIEYIQKNIVKHEKSLCYTMVSPHVVRCKFRNDSNLIGALYHYLTKMMAGSNLKF